jgi:DNA-binding MarR family transcriptional regulator
MELFLLGRRLMVIADTALPQGKGTTSLRLVLIDVAYHPNSSISEITERTRFPQSLVSLSVAKLRDIGVVETASDPADGRRTLVRATRGMSERAEQRGGTPIETVIAKQLGPEHEDQIGEALAALDVLARLLTPEVTSQGVRSATESDEESRSNRSSGRSIAVGRQPSPQGVH